MNVQPQNLKISEQEQTEIFELAQQLYNFKEAPNLQSQSNFKKRLLHKHAAFQTKKQLDINKNEKKISTLAKSNFFTIFNIFRKLATTTAVVILIGILSVAANEDIRNSLLDTFEPKGSLIIMTDPPDEKVQIYIDTKYQGETPIEIKRLKTGKHILKSIKNNYKEYFQEFEIEAKKVTIITIKFGKEEMYTEVSQNIQIILEPKYISIDTTVSSTTSPAIEMINPTSEKTFQQLGLKMNIFDDWSIEEESDPSYYCDGASVSISKNNYFLSIDLEPLITGGGMGLQFDGSDYQEYQRKNIKLKDNIILSAQSNYITSESPEGLSFKLQKNSKYFAGISFARIINDPLREGRLIGIKKPIKTSNQQLIYKTFHYLINFDFGQIDEKNLLPTIDNPDLQKRIDEAITMVRSIEFLNEPERKVISQEEGNFNLYDKINKGTYILSTKDFKQEKTSIPSCFSPIIGKNIIEGTFYLSFINKKNEILDEISLGNKQFIESTNHNGNIHIVKLNPKNEDDFILLLQYGSCVGERLEIYGTDHKLGLNQYIFNNESQKALFVSNGKGLLNLDLELLPSKEFITTFYSDLEKKDITKKWRLNGFSFEEV